MCIRTFKNINEGPLIALILILLILKDARTSRYHNLRIFRCQNSLAYAKINAQNVLMIMWYRVIIIIICVRKLFNVKNLSYEISWT